MRKEKPAGEILDLATSDEALMHTIILLAANYWVRKCGDPATVAFSLAHHKVEAIRIINERLGDPEMAAMDGTIGAVAGLSLVEVSIREIPSSILILTLKMVTNGSPETAIHHLNGLEHLVRLRGDLQTRPLQATVQQMILVSVFPSLLPGQRISKLNLHRADTLTSSATLSNRRFPSSIFGEDDSLRRPSTSNNTSNSSAARPAAASAYSAAYILGSLCFEAIKSIDWETTRMFLDLRSLSAEIAANDAGIHLSRPVGLIDHMSSAQKYIDSLIHHRINSASSISFG
jgi:hypothetical protein